MRGDLLNLLQIMNIAKDTKIKKDEEYDKCYAFCLINW